MTTFAKKNIEIPSFAIIYVNISEKCRSDWILTCNKYVLFLILYVYGMYMVELYACIILKPLVIIYVNKRANRDSY